MISGLSKATAVQSFPSDEAATSELRAKAKHQKTSV
ncbi:hypothetical protein F3P66_04305 [Agrobacterium fabrum]|uniref:Uncharacterized protein n=1 Tax=Agrobacterium fabrum (strain C58 / ATCC 33970) TaxID=176299 RepID=Q8U565_AGRFC|nr:hypothetical protein Atu8024 [Agrobacterium fabrum str. C58]QRM58741.1 hypothetical protein F3P66_04305 [Agrobacterium fabrum]TRB25439.1 hypothetical protein EXN51_23855 [Agrobacterium fabrum]